MILNKGGSKCASTKFAQMQILDLHEQVSFHLIFFLQVVQHFPTSGSRTSSIYRAIVT